MVPHCTFRHSDRNKAHHPNEVEWAVHQVSEHVLQKQAAIKTRHVSHITAARARQPPRHVKPKKPIGARAAVLWLKHSVVSLDMI